MMIRPASIGMCCLAGLLLALPAQAQGTRRTPPGNTRLLDVQAEKVQQDFVKGLLDLALKYEEAGDLGKAKEMFQSILKVRPDAESAARKLKEYDEAAFKDNKVDIEVDSSRGWTATGLAVTKDKPLHLNANGTYKLIVNEDVDANGYPSRDPQRDLISGIPTGALMAIVVSPSQGGGRNRSDEPRPVLIGSEQEFTPKESGLLMLKLNVPPNSRSIGKVRVTVTGNFTR